MTCSALFTTLTEIIGTAVRIDIAANRKCFQSMEQFQRSISILTEALTHFYTVNDGHDDDNGGHAVQVHDDCLRVCWCAIMLPCRSNVTAAHD